MTGFDILAFLVLLGVLVFVHELGHFVAAKMCGVYVERFSIGMPPRLFGFKIGETDYCIQLLPLGGYVKMAGQEDVPMSDEERAKTYGDIPPERWFNNKPRWQRAFIFIAGPAMNIVLGFFVFVGMGLAGWDVPLSRVDTRVGLIDEEGAAASAPMYAVNNPSEPVERDEEPDTVGWQPGDRILSVNGKEMTRFLDLVYEVALSGGKELRTVIERPSIGGESQYFVSFVEPVQKEGEEIPSVGVGMYQTALVQRVIPGTPADSNGLQEGDVILSADGKPVDSISFSTKVKQLPSGSQVTLEVERDGTIIDKTLGTETHGTFEGILFSPPLDPLVQLGNDEAPSVAIPAGTDLRRGDTITTLNGEPATGSLLRALANGDPTAPVMVTVERDGAPLGGDTPTQVELQAHSVIEAVTGVPDDAPITVAAVDPELAEATGLKAKDQIVAADGAPATRQALRRLQEERIGETISIEVKRPAILYGLARSASEFEAELTVEPISMVGVVWGQKTVFQRVPLGEIVPYALSECWRVMTQIGTVVSMLVQGEVSLKMLGGPVMIADVTAQAARSGLMYFLDTMAMISINLALVNLLPIPVLDGGQLLILGVEAIRRKPVNMKLLETMQQVGLLLILALIVYVTFNDVSRLVDRLIP